MNPHFPEGARVPEYEKQPVSIRLEFFRHDEKAKATTSGDRTGDEFVRLTPQGRIHSTEVGKTKNPHPEVAVAFGSPRERSMETSMRQMLANEDDISPERSLEDIRSLVDAQLKVGKKDKVIAELNFDWDTNKAFHDLAYQHFMETKDTLAFLYHDSDKVVKENKDTASSAYTRMAANFASMVKKYVEILPRWKELIKENPDKYAASGNQMERYFGSHAAAVENFLMKTMEKVEGKEAVEEFLKGPKKNGFAYSEGYTVDIKDSEAGPQITLTYDGKVYPLSENILNEMIKEGQELEAEVQAN